MNSEPLSPTFGNSVWNIGAKAAAEQGDTAKCPFPWLSYDAVVWYNGWSFSMHSIAKKDDEL